MHGTRRLLHTINDNCICVSDPFFSIEQFHIISKGKSNIKTSKTRFRKSSLASNEISRNALEMVTGLNWTRGEYGFTCCERKDELQRSCFGIQTFAEEEEDQRS